MGRKKRLSYRILSVILSLMVVISTAIPSLADEGSGVPEYNNDEIQAIKTTGCEVKINDKDIVDGTELRTGDAVKLKFNWTMSDEMSTKYPSPAKFVIDLSDKLKQFRRYRGSAFPSGMAQFASRSKNRGYSSDAQTRIVLLQRRISSRGYALQHQLRRQPQECHRRKLNDSGIQYGRRRPGRSVVYRPGSSGTAPRGLPASFPNGFSVYSRPLRCASHSRPACLTPLERLRMGHHARFLE